MAGSAAAAGHRRFDPNRPNSNFSALFYWINMTLCISEVYLKHAGTPSDVNLPVNYVCGKKTGFTGIFTGKKTSTSKT